MGTAEEILSEVLEMSAANLNEDEEGIFDGCFYVWVDVTKKYMKNKDEKMFNDYEKLENKD